MKDTVYKVNFDGTTTYVKMLVETGSVCESEQIIFISCNERGDKPARPFYFMGHLNDKKSKDAGYIARIGGEKFGVFPLETVEQENIRFNVGDIVSVEFAGVGRRKFLLCRLNVGNKTKIFLFDYDNGNRLNDDGVDARYDYNNQCYYLVYDDILSQFSSIFCSNIVKVKWRGCSV